jgi:hypothetical protein
VLHIDQDRGVITCARTSFAVSLVCRLPSQVSRGFVLITAHVRYREVWAGLWRKRRWSAVSYGVWYICTWRSSPSRGVAPRQMHACQDKCMRTIVICVIDDHITGKPCLLPLIRSPHDPSLMAPVP